MPRCTLCIILAQNLPYSLYIDLADCASIITNQAARMSPVGAIKWASTSLAEVIVQLVQHLFEIMAALEFDPQDVPFYFIYA